MLQQLFCTNTIHILNNCCCLFPTPHPISFNQVSLFYADSCSLETSAIVHSVKQN